MLSTCRKLLLAALTLIAIPAFAQEYPKQTINLVVPFPPAGITDILARVISDKMGQSFGQTVVVLNKPGAAGFIAAQAVKQAQPDGYTLFMGHMGTHVVNPAMFASLPYNPTTDFIPITNLVATTHILVVSGESPVKSVADLIARAKTVQGGLTYASQGVGSGGQLLAEMFKLRTGIPVNHVPYKGSPQAVQDMLANRVDFFFDSLNASLPQVLAGRLRALASTTPKRIPQLPDLPTMAELGLAGIDLAFWFGMFVPAGTPDPIVNKVHDELVRIMRLPDVRERIATMGVADMTGSRADFEARIKADAELWGKVIKDANIKGE
jgi:tripartite-type tricarboxylate transporter receptor subunit TctC